MDEKQTDGEYPINIPSSKPVKTRRGWRFFHCQECEHRWKWPSRDALSPSGENCPRCDEWCYPYNSEIDATIPCDNMGNLTVPHDWNPKP